jgi:hypothetical protein
MDKEFLLQINPKEFRLYDALRQLPVDCEIVLSDKPAKNRHLLEGRRVYLWQAGDQGGLVARGTVLRESDKRPMPEWQHQFCVSGSPDPNQKRAIIRVDLRLKTPLTRAEIRQDQVLCEKPFFRNEKGTEGTVFRPDSGAGAALDRLIEAASE